MTKTILAALALTAAALLALPASVGFAPVLSGTSLSADSLGIWSEFEKRRKPRVPGGSGCDTPQDVAEHSECQV